MGIAQNLETIKKNIKTACENKGRNPGDVRIIAVTKTRTPEEINDTHPLFNYDENYTTYVFCYNSDGTVSGQWCFDLTSGARRRYVVTYGDLHDKWLSFQSNDECSPDGNVLNGIKGHFSGDILIGYVKPNGDDTASLVNSIGQVIYDFDTNMYATMDENCNLRCNGSCIAFVSEL